MPSRFVLPLLTFLALTPLLRAESTEIGFIEQFALAPDREAVLGQLIPASEDYYFFYALHYQNTRQAAKLAGFLEQWRARFRESPRRRIIENREALLSYDADPQATLKFLRERLNLQFNDRQEARDRKPDLPVALDPALISREVFQRNALASAENLSQLSEGALEDLVRGQAVLTRVQVRALLSRLKRPDLPNLVELIAGDLKSRESRGFGEFPIHAALLPEQLDDLARRLPALYENQAFVYARLRKLAPGADADATDDPGEREAWLDRAWAYVSHLPPAFSSLKANLLYRRLQHDRTRGVYDEARLLEYVKLPRRASYVNPKYLEAPEQLHRSVDLDADFSQAIPLAVPIHSDEELVRDYLLHLFPKLDVRLGDLEPADLLKKWTPYLRESWLRAVLAEAMLTHGIGDPERWASLLSPPAFQQLKDRVDLDFARTNPPLSAPADDVALELEIKNAPKVIVKVYEINALSYFLAHQQQLNTDLPLDGLVANSERVEDCSADPAGHPLEPFRRVARTFRFPELKEKRGAWVIEFIGGGKSSRALVRKGQWSLVQQTGPGGDLLTVLDEKKAPVPDAAVWLDGRMYTVEPKSGFIVVPFTQQPGTKPVILADATGAFATLAHFEHHAEQYRLDAQFQIAREQLLARKDATLAIRATLLLGNAQVSPSLLSETRLTLVSKSLDGVSTTAEIEGVMLDPAKDYTHTFPVPERLAQLTVTLTGKVENLSQGGEKQDLSASQTWNLNGIDLESYTSDVHLSRMGPGYVCELLGKDGEPLPDQQIVFTFNHADFAWQQTVALKTDARGRVALGDLSGLKSVQAQAPNGRSASWELADFERTWPAAIHARAGESVRIPLPPRLAEAAKPEALWHDISVLELHGGTFAVDHTQKARAEGGFLVVEGLPAGDFSVRLRDGAVHEIALRITAGVPVRHWLEGPHRGLEIRDAAPVQIAWVQVGAEQLAIRIANFSPYTRVHLAASRFLPGEGLFSLAQFARFTPGETTPDKLPSLFAAGRKIGDEYRYILERRYAKLFPGNMLARPGLILNPWETRSTESDLAEMLAGQAAGRMAGNRSGSTILGMDARSPDQLARSDKALKQAALSGTDLDFLATAIPAIYNLTPDEQGWVHVDLKALGDRQHVQIYAEDLSSAVWRSFALPEKATKFQDLRLAQSLDPKQAFTEKKEAGLLAKGESLTLGNIVTSDLETYDSLQGVYALFSTLSNDPTLAKFSWLMQWPKLKPEEQRAKYSEFACHELNFFLFHHDPEFFRKVVLPYLANKKDKTFMDDYLLGRDLSGYLAPWAYARLNVAERCLLGQRVPGEAEPAARHLRELWEIKPPDPESEDRLFNMALHGRGLEPGDAGGLQDEKRRAYGEATSVTTRSLGLPSIPGLSPDPAAAPAAPVPESPFANIKKEKGSALSFQGGLKESVQAADAPAPAPHAMDAEQLKPEEAQLQRQIVRPYYRSLGPTKEWAENNYYDLRISAQNADLIGINAFWRDYAAWDGRAPFISPHLTESATNFAGMMLALAVLDLPFEPSKPEVKNENGHFTFTATAPAIVFHKEIKPAAPGKGEAELLVSQNFYREDDRYRQEGNEQFEKYVTEEFLTGVVYGANVVVSNPTSTPQKLSVLLQIPQGALPVHGSKTTESKALRLEAYTTQTFGYYFYFPAPSAQPFTHYPVNVARHEESAGAAKPVTFKVVRQLSTIDKSSWDYISQYGSEEDVWTFLEHANVERVALERVAWRARESAAFFRRIVAFMARRHIYNDVLYSYAVVQNDTPALREWLRHRDDFLAECGPALYSKLLTIDPIERRTYEHLEYSPLVNQRSHRVGPHERVANSVLRAQYQALLNILAHKPALDPMDQMSVVYYLFLQDRVEEGLARFHAIDPEKLPTRLQHDYFRCYAAFYEEQLPAARDIAQKYADYPVDRWRKLFADVHAQLEEIAGAAAAAPRADGQPDREAQQAALAETEPSFDLKVENRQIALTWRNLTDVTVNYYLMDPEFLFSSSPFVTEDPARFSIVKPAKSAVVKLPAGKDALVFPLPDEFARANVLVEILGGGGRKAQAYHANTLKLALTENYGRLELREQAGGHPVSKAYVKVYARLRDGTVRFYKDGYTDLRGKFDYASLNGSDSTHPEPTPADSGHAGAGTMTYQMLQPQELQLVEKLAILIVSEAHGALVREVDPPRQ